MTNEGFKPTIPDEEAPITPESETAASAEQDNSSENISDEQAQKLGSAALEATTLQGEEEAEEESDDIYDKVSENKVITADDARKWHEQGEDIGLLLEARGYDEVTSDELKTIIDAGFSANEVADCFDEWDFDENGLMSELVKDYGADIQRIADRLYGKLQNCYELYGDAKEMDAHSMAEVMDELKKLGANIDYDNASRMIDINVRLDNGEDIDDDDDDDDDLDEESKKFYESQEWINDGWD